MFFEVLKLKWEKKIFGKKKRGKIRLNTNIMILLINNSGCQKFHKNFIDDSRVIFYVEFKFKVKFL